MWRYLGSVNVPFLNNLCLMDLKYVASCQIIMMVVAKECCSVFGGIGPGELFFLFLFF